MSLTISSTTALPPVRKTTNEQASALDSEMEKLATLPQNPTEAKAVLATINPIRDFPTLSAIYSELTGATVTEDSKVTMEAVRIIANAMENYEAMDAEGKAAQEAAYSAILTEPSAPEADKSEPEAEGRTLHVAQNGGGEFATIGAAVKAAKPGDTILVEGGTYRERVVIHGLQGTEEAPIHIQGEGAVIDADGFDNALRISGDTRYVTVSGFTIQNAEGSGISIGDPDPSGKRINPSYVTITDNQILNNGARTREKGGHGGQGIFAAGSHITIEDNVISNSGEHNIYLAGEYMLVEDNELSGASRMGVRSEGDHTQILGNYFHDNGESGFSVWNDATFSANDVLIEGNTFENNGKADIRIHSEGAGDAPDGVTIQSNSFVASDPEKEIKVSAGVAEVARSENIRVQAANWNVADPDEEITETIQQPEKINNLAMEYEKARVLLDWLDPVLRTTG